jgi:hypothetical protein
MLAERDDHALLHVVDVVLTPNARVDPVAPSTPEDQELGAEPQIDCSSTHLLWVKQWGDDESTAEVGLPHRLVQVFATKSCHAVACQEPVNVLISIALPTRS